MNTQTVGYKAKEFELRNLTFFFMLAWGLPLFFAALFIFGIVRWPSQVGPGMIILLVVLNFAPMIAAFVVTGITEGKPGVRALWKRFWNRNLSIKWLLVALLLNPAIRLVASLVNRTLEGDVYPILASNTLGLFLNGLIIGMREEFGWRGYALPRFQAKWNALTSSIILGAIWATYHLGNWFLPPGRERQDNFWEFSLWIILLSILHTWIFNNTNGSVLASVLFHGVVTNGVIGCCGDSMWGMEYLIGFTLLTAILIVIIFGPKNLVRERPAEGIGLEQVRAIGA